MLEVRLKGCVGTAKTESGKVLNDLRKLLHDPSLTTRGSCSRRVICHGKWISSIPQDLILNSLKRQALSGWKCESMTLMHPHNPALARMTGGVPVFKLSGSDTWSTKVICTVRSSPRLSEDASVTTGDTFSVDVSEYSLTGVGICKP